MPLKDLCKTVVVCIGPDSTAVEAASMMRDKQVGELIVVEGLNSEARPIGVVTDRDLVTKVMAFGLDPRAIEVADFMTSCLTTAMESDGLLDASRKFQQSAIRRLPVTDEAGHLTGIISIDDVYELLATEITSLASVSSRQIARERTDVPAQL